MFRFGIEKDAVLNAGSSRRFDDIEQIKAASEVECLGIVPNADVVALASRDATVKAYYMQILWHRMYFNARTPASFKTAAKVLERASRKI